MAIKTLVLGESGTGKSSSLRNFNFDEVCYINPAKKPLPFKGKLNSLIGETDVLAIRKFIMKANKKIVVIDDAQYVMAFQYMHRLRESGWDKYNDIQSDFFQLIEMADELPDDVTVYFLSHIEVKEDGRQKIKTIGKMLDEKITIEGMFTTVLKTYVSDGKYFFLTQNGGNDTVKSPIGMFPTFAIDNDLNYVDEKIRNYYEIGEYKSDEEMKAADEIVKNEEIEKAANGRTKRGKAKDEAAEQPKEERKARSRKKADEPTQDDKNIKVEDLGDVPFDPERDGPTKSEPPKERKSRKKADEAVDQKDTSASETTEEPRRSRRSRRSRKEQA